MDRSIKQKYTEYYDDFDVYMKKCIIPDVFACQLCNYYIRGLLNGEDLKQYTNSIGDVFNIDFSFEEIRKDVEEVLKIKYNLVIVKDNPLVIKPISNDIK